MIKYALACRACGAEHDSWFKNAADYDRLAAGGHLSCASCGSAEVGKAIMAPRITKGRNGAAPANPVEALRALRRKIEAEAVNVGDRFAEEARRIHAGEAPARFIYGDATPEQAERLRDEGVPVAAVPWVPLTDA